MNLPVFDNNTLSKINNYALDAGFGYTQLSDQEVAETESEMASSASGWHLIGPGGSFTIRAESEDDNYDEDGEEIDGDTFTAGPGTAILVSDMMGDGTDLRIEYVIDGGGKVGYYLSET